MFVWVFVFPTLCHARRRNGKNKEADAQDLGQDGLGHDFSPLEHWTKNSRLRLAFYPFGLALSTRKSSKENGGFRVKIWRGNEAEPSCEYLTNDYADVGRMHFAAIDKVELQTHRHSNEKIYNDFL